MKCWQQNKAIKKSVPELQFGNPYWFVRKFQKSIFHTPPPEFIASVNLADTYLLAWESMFTDKYSSYNSIRNSATPEEQKTVTKSVEYLADLLFNLEAFNAQDEDFEKEFKSEVAKVCSPQLFAENQIYVSTTNVISKATTESLFLLRNKSQIELVNVLSAAILFSFVRYPEWIQEKYGLLP